MCIEINGEIGLHLHCLSCIREFQFHLQHLKCTNGVIAFDGQQKYLICELQLSAFLMIFSKILPFLGPNFILSFFLPRKISYFKEFQVPLQDLHQPCIIRHLLERKYYFCGSLWSRQREVYHEVLNRTFFTDNIAQLQSQKWLNSLLFGFLFLPQKRSRPGAL